MEAIITEQFLLAKNVFVEIAVSQCELSGHNDNLFVMFGFPCMILFYSS